MKAPRRALLKAAAFSPLLLVAGAGRGEGADYASASDVLGTIDAIENDVSARLRRLAADTPRARPVAASFLGDYARHRAARDRARRRLHVASAPQVGEVVSDDATLDGLRGQLESLVYAHAEGLPALGDAFVVDLLSRHMIDLSRQLTVVDLWIEAGAERE